MKIAGFTDAAGTRIGLVEGDHLLDLSRVAPALPTTVRALLEAGPAAMELLRQVGGRFAADIPLAAVRLEAPVPDPAKFFAIAMNYHLVTPHSGMSEATVAETREKQAAIKRGGRQMWYNKQVTCITGPFDRIERPADATELFFEAELAFVIGRTCRDVSLADAPGVIAGYTVCNDVTEGAWCRGSATLTLGKSVDTFGPTGPWIVTPDELGDPHALAIEGSVNGVVQQIGNTRDMIFNCYELVAFASRRCTLQAGDIVTTGMPYCRLEKLTAGDVVRCSVAGIGSIENVVGDRVG